MPIKRGFKCGFRVGASHLHFVPALCLHALAVPLHTRTLSLRFVESGRASGSGVSDRGSGAYNRPIPTLSRALSVALSTSSKAAGKAHAKVPRILTADVLLRRRMCAGLRRLEWGVSD